MAIPSTKTWPDHPFNKDETVKCTKNEKAPVNLRRRMRRNFEVFASVSIGVTTVPDRSLVRNPVATRRPICVTVFCPIYFRFVDEYCK